MTKTDAEVTITTGTVHKWGPWFAGIIIFCASTTALGVLAWSQLNRDIVMNDVNAKSAISAVDQKHVSYETLNDRYLSERRQVNEARVTKVETDVKALKDDQDKIRADAVAKQQAFEQRISDMKSQLDVAVALLKRIDEKTGKQ